jgi:phage repressor protein C with HTH and peptisase S24 domain
VGVGKRIREAREALDLTQEQLAEMVGCKQTDVYRIETGKVTHSRYLAPILKVLHLSENTHTVVPLVGYIGAGAEVFAIDDHEKGDGLEMIPAPPGMLNGIALIVRGTSMTPKYDDGEVIFIEKTVYAIDSLIGENCYLQLPDGRSYLKKLQYGSRPGLYSLISYNAPPIIDVPIERAYPIAFTKPKYRNLK